MRQKDNGWFDAGDLGSFIVRGSVAPDGGLVCSVFAAETAGPDGVPHMVVMSIVGGIGDKGIIIHSSGLSPVAHMVGTRLTDLVDIGEVLESIVSAMTPQEFGSLLMDPYACVALRMLSMAVIDGSVARDGLGAAPHRTGGMEIETGEYRKSRQKAIDEERYEDIAAIDIRLERLRREAVRMNRKEGASSGLARSVLSVLDTMVADGEISETALVAAIGDGILATLGEI